MKKVDNKVSVDDIVKDMCALKDDFQEYMKLSKQKAIIQDSIIDTQSKMIDLYKNQSKELYISCIILAIVSLTSLIAIAILL